MTGPTDIKDISFHVKPLKVCSVNYQFLTFVQLSFFMEEKFRVSGYNSLVPGELQLFSLVNNTGLDEAQPVPNCEGFIQN